MDQTLGVRGHGTNVFTAAKDPDLGKKILTLGRIAKGERISTMIGRDSFYLLPNLEYR